MESNSYNSKRVDFNIAIAIKNAGYPQRSCPKVYLSDGSLVPYHDYYSDCFDAPTYFQVWVWLWREKKIHIDVDSDDCYGNGCISYDDYTFEEHNTDDPEKAIISAIKYLVAKKILK